MIFESLKLIRIANELSLKLEELVILQMIYDYNHLSKNLDINAFRALDEEYKKYSKDDLAVFTIIENLIAKSYLEDNRRNRHEFTLNELTISEDILLKLTGGLTDEELFEEFKAIYPFNYVNEYGKASSNHNMSAKEEKELFENFKKKILGGAKMKNFSEFMYITKELFPSPECFSDYRMDRYVNSFNTYKKIYREKIS